MPPRKKRIFKSAKADDKADDKSAEDKLLEGDDGEAGDDGETEDSQAAEADTKTEEEILEESGNISIDIELKDVVRPRPTKPQAVKKPEVKSPVKTADSSEVKAVAEVKKPAEVKPVTEEQKPATESSPAAVTAETVPKVTSESAETKTEVKEDTVAATSKEQIIVEAKVEAPMDVSDEKTEAKSDTTAEKTVVESQIKTEDGATNTADGGAETDKTPADSATTSETSEAKPEQKDQRFKFAYPASFAKLRQLTVNIGPIKQRDLMSNELHGILMMNNDFEIKFELKTKTSEDGTVRKEKLGYVRVPFSIKTPNFLVNIANKLGELHIDGRDMSVKFPDAFNKALEDCKKYVKDHHEEMARMKKAKLELKKRQIIVRNVPAATTEETIKSMFPEASKVEMNMIKTEDGSKKVGSVILEFATIEACTEFMDTNKDVQIEDSKVTFHRLASDPLSYEAKQLRNQRQKANRKQAAKLSGGGSKSGRGQFWNSGAPGQNGTRGGASPRGGVGRQNNTMKGNMGPPPPRSVSSVNRGQFDQGRRFSGGGRNRSGSQDGGGNQDRRGNQFGPQTVGSMQRNRGGRNQRGGRGFGNDRRSSFGSQGGNQSPRSLFGGNLQGRSQTGRLSPVRNLPSSADRSPRDDDPVAMMAYLKSTLARMEEKISVGSGNRGGDDRRDSYGYGSGYGNDGGDNAARNRKRKRKEDYKDSNQDAKRLYNIASGHADNRDSNRQTSSYTKPAVTGSSSYQGYGGYGNQASNLGSYNQSGGYGLQTGSYGTSTGSYGTSAGTFGAPATNYGNQTGTYGNQNYSNQGYNQGSMTGSTGTSSYGNPYTSNLGANTTQKSTGTTGAQWQQW